MGYMSEYIQKRVGSKELEDELIKLISEYNRMRGTYLVVFVTSIQKRIPEAQLEQDDYFMIADMLSSQKGRGNIDFYLETPGGSGEAAEEIVRYLHANFGHVTFVVSGEAKSAGTIMVLSGHEIFMTDTGSLGPIDAQIYIQRYQSSAYDYMEWVEEKQKIAEQTGSLNTFDAIMTAQISPGELNGVYNSLQFAKDLVVEWLSKYKFAKWDITETRGIPVSTEMKKDRALEIADILCNHSRWRSHGRSIKIQDLSDIQLKTTRIDDNPPLADIVYRIQTVCRLLASSTTAYKIYATEHEKIFKHAAPSAVPPIPQRGEPDIAEINQTCPQCGNIHNIFCRLNPTIEMKPEHIAKGFIYYPADDKLKCSCGFETDLSGIRNQIEIQFGKKIFK